MKIQIENLKGFMRGMGLSIYHKNLAINEFNKLVAYTEELEQLNLACVINSLPLNFETLPTKIQEKMFEKHEHAELLNPEEICYKESDVVDIINMIYGNDL